MLSALVIALMSLNTSNAPALGDELAAPVRLEAAGKPIDTEIGHAAPFVCDWNGDGKPDLLAKVRDTSAQRQKDMLKELSEIAMKMMPVRAQLPRDYEYHGWVWLFLRK